MTTAYYADENIKLILDALKRNKLYEDTVIIYTTDHGVALPFNKCNLTDTGIGVAMIIRVPRAKSNGEVMDNLVSHIDVFPTLCELLSLEKPEYLEGKSFKKVFDNSKEEIRDFIFSEINFHTSYEPVRCIRTNRYKYIKYYDNNWNKINLSNIDESDPKTFLMKNGLKEQIKYREGLFDLYYDPSERNNLVEDEKSQSILEELREKLYQEQVSRYKSIEDTLNATLITAQSAAEDTCSAANKKAKIIVEEAQLQSKHIIDEANNRILELKKEYDDLVREFKVFRNKFKSLIKDQMDTIDEIFCDVDESCEIPFRECSYMKEDIDDTAELFTEEVEVEPEEIVDNIILTKDDDDSAENAVTNK